MKTHRAMWLAAAGILAAAFAPAGVREDLVTLRNRCLWFSAGRLPYATNSTIRHDLYAQSPFSASSQIDLAASGFALAALPAAVESGILTSNAARTIAAAAAARVLDMVRKSVSATTDAARAKYGYEGMLYHYSSWTNTYGEFWGDPGVEVSPIDTTLLLYGLAVCGGYFGGSVRSNAIAARETINWRAWIDTTPGHRNQVRMAWLPGSGFTGWWDWRTDETSLICLMAAASDTNLDAVALWNGWIRGSATYVSPAPNSKTFACVPTWFGDPFTDFYGLHFVDTKGMPRDVNGYDWFGNSRTSYLGHVEYFAKERGYLHSLNTAFALGEVAGVVARPCGAGDPPAARTDAAVYSVAGGLYFYDSNPASNDMALALSRLATQTASFYRWHGCPAATVYATYTNHPVKSDYVVGQDICSIALSIDNYLTQRVYRILERDAAWQRVLTQVFPPLEWAGVSPTGEVVFLATTASQLFSGSLENGRTGRVNWAWTFDGGGVLATAGVAQSSFQLTATPELLGPHLVGLEVCDGCNADLARGWLVIVGEGDPGLLLHWSFDSDGRDLSGWGNGIPINNDAAIGWDGVSGHALELRPP